MAKRSGSSDVVSDVRSFRPRVRRRVVKNFDPKSSRVKQSDATATNINFIMKRYGGIPQNPNANFNYGSLVGLPSYEECLNVVIRGQEVFDALPSEIRAKFRNDPKEFLKFMDDPANKDEAIKLGLVKAPAEQPNTSPNPPNSTEPPAGGGKLSNEGSGGTAE